MKRIIFAATALLLSSCASYRPVLDENSKYKKVGEARAERDIDMCLSKADSYLEKHKSGRMKNAAIRGAGQGAVIGGVVGLLSGGRGDTALGGAVLGAGVGAAGGALGESTKDKWKPDELKQRYVQSCLARKNYAVIGWK